MDADRRSILSAVDHEMGLTRREIVACSGLAGMGALLATIGVEIGEARAQSAGYAEGDLKILNVALGLEHEAIAAYQAGAASKLLDKPILRGRPAPRPRQRALHRGERGEERYHGRGQDSSLLDRAHLRARLRVMEVELNEPGLFFTFAPAAAAPRCVPARRERVSRDGQTARSTA
jgi:hypothetical protein